MRIKRTYFFEDYTHAISSKTISAFDVEDIDAFVKKKEDAVGTGDIAIAIHEIHNKICHKLTIRYANIDPLKIEEIIIYEWEDN